MSARFLAILLSFLAFETLAKPLSSVPNPYQPIVERNVFGLKPETIEISHPPKPVQLPPITLTGLTTILGKEQALLTIQVPGGKSYILAEGQREGELVISHVDTVAGIVTLTYANTPITLNLGKR